VTTFPSKRARQRAWFRAHHARVRGPSRERSSPAAQANSQVFSFTESCFCFEKKSSNLSVHGLDLTQESIV
jgi:hypothetical protein